MGGRAGLGARAPGATVIACLALVTGAAAQQPARRKPPAPTPPAPASERCVFQIDNVDRRGAVNETPTGTNYFAGGNVRLSCRGTEIAMQSDSVAAYGGNVVQFIGHVKYRDSTLTMDASRGTYYKNGERWAARGDVNTKNLETGSTMPLNPAKDARVFTVEQFDDGWRVTESEQTSETVPC